MLELRNIKKYFNKGTPSETIAIDDLSLQIKPGEFVTIIGGNGGTIFLPAAGGRSDSELYGAGSEGGFSSSTLNEDNEYDAYNFYFGSDFVLCWDGSRRYGQSVRPVR